MGINDIEMETEEYLVRDGTWEASPHGISNARSVVLVPSLFDEAHHYPNGYLKDGIAIAKLTGGVNVGKYAPFDTAVATDGQNVMAGVIVDNPRVFKPGTSTLKSAVMSAMPDHCMVFLDKLPPAGADVAGSHAVTEAQLPKGYIAR